jgi:hypothetical protein
MPCHAIDSIMNHVRIDVRKAAVGVMNTSALTGAGMRE